MLYANNDTAYIDISYMRNANGTLTIEVTPEFMQYGEHIKAIKSEKAYLQAEVKMIAKDGGVPRVLEIEGSKYVTEGHFALRTDDAGIAQINERAIAVWHEALPNGMQIAPIFDKKLVEGSYSADVAEFIPYTPEDKKGAKTPPYYVVVAGGIAHVYNKKFVDSLKKRSASIKLTSSGDLMSTTVVGYDADGNIVGFVLPVKENGFFDKDGNKIPFATNRNLKSLVNKKTDGTVETPDDVENSVAGETATAETVTEPTESVVNSEKAEGNTPVAEEKTEYKHLYNEETVSEDFINSVNPEIESAILNIRNGNIEAVSDVVEVTELTEEAIKKISAFVGFDVSDYSCKIEKDALQHIENRHGINGSHDHSLSDPKDTARMGYIVNNSDSVDWIREKDGEVKTSKKYRDKNNKPAKLVMVQKKIDGTYCVSDVVPDSKNKTIWVASARIQKKYQDLDDNNVSPKTTPENALNASDAIIAEETQNVNTSEEITTPTLTDKCELHETTHTKTGEALWVISLNDKISSDEYKALSAAVKKVGGYYSKFAKTPDGKAIPGFIFKSEPTAEVINTFNNFFGTETTDETAPAEAKSTVKEIDTEALLGAVENAKVSDEIKLSDHEKQSSTEHVGLSMMCYKNN